MARRMQRKTRIIKRITALVGAMVLTVAVFATAGFGAVNATGERTTVINSLPELTVYSDTDRDYGLADKDIKVYVNDAETEFESASTFGESGERLICFMLIDVSRSLQSKDLDLIKESIESFAESLSGEDRIFLIPFGESVYTDKTAYEPRSEKFAKAVEAIVLKDDYTQLYQAMDAAVGLTETEAEAETEGRRIAMVFSDGVDETTGGMLTGEEAVKRMADGGIPLYAFAVGDDKDGKDKLGVLARSTGGAMDDLTANGAQESVKSFREVLDKTLVIKAKVKNSEDINDYFTLRVTANDEEVLIKENIRAHKTEASKDAFSVAASKFFKTYWWIFAVGAIALIVVIALLVIKRNRGVVNVDGKVVYGSKVERRYHVQVREYNTKELDLIISINGGPEEKQTVSVTESLIVGRAQSCDMSFEDPSMSRQHFSLSLSEGEIYLDDLESTGGTYLNGVRVYGKQRVGQGDVISAGRTRIRIG